MPDLRVLTMPNLAFLPEDLAPGDRLKQPLDPRELSLVRIGAPDHPDFDEAYQLLWDEFGALHEMEERTVILERLRWQPVHPAEGRWLRYEMVLVRRGGRSIAVRDQVAVITSDLGDARCLVHLSHVWVHPEWRRTGLAAWLRAAPIQTARAGLFAAGLSPASPITLVAEMEHPDERVEARQIRLRSYEKAGFLKIDPTVIPYRQPDFRPPSVIQADGCARPLPFALIIRRVGQEKERRIAKAEARWIVDSLYRMYATSFRPQDMIPLWEAQRDWAVGEGFVDLVRPL